MLFQFIIKILCRKDVQIMAVIPEKIKEKVKEVLVALDCPELAE